MQVYYNMVQVHVAPQFLAERGLARDILVFTKRGTNGVHSINNFGDTRKNMLRLSTLVLLSCRRPAMTLAIVDCGMPTWQQVPTGSFCTRPAGI